jgi:phosphotransferase system enzyme I (PtsI)
LNASRPESVFRGNGVSPGVAVGRALKLDSHHRFILKNYVPDSELDNEVRRFRLAVQASREQLENLKSRLQEKAGKEHSFILDAHLLMLEDSSLLAPIESIIRTSHANAEWAVQEAAERVGLAYEALEDEYFRDRGRDIEYVVDRILYNLSGDKPFSWDELPDDLIIVAHDLSPSAFASMDLHKVRGVALESGGRTSHTAILARSLRLPTMMEIRDFLPSVKTGDPVILNADEGELTVWPSVELQDALRCRLTAFQAAELAAFAGPTPATTKDGIAVSLRANTELPHEAAVAKRCGAEGIGLFRSEFIFFAHPHGPPNTHEQFEIYSMLAKEMSPHPVAVRTLDAGIDRSGTRADLAAEPNPSMGLRGIRLSLAARNLFAAQIEAILRASSHGNVEIVIPMVSAVEEIREAKRLIEQVRKTISKGAGGEKPVPVGVMIEVPAAVLTLDSIADEVDFLCVGTNDLVQYLLAVDRENPQVAHLFQPLHPSVLHCLNRVASVSLRHAKPARICGEISANPFFAVLLLGMGYRQLSMNPLSIPSIRTVVNQMNMKEAESLAARLLGMPTAHEISEHLIAAVPRLLNMDLTPYVRELRKPAVVSETDPGS